LLAKACLGLINTLFLARIKGLFGSGYRPFSLRFWLSFVSGPNQSTRVDSLWLIFQKLFKLMQPKFWQPLMNNTSEFFSFNV
jgi:hypothetical protein